MVPKLEEIRDVIAKRELIYISLDVTREYD